jgi:hypothetical protein
MGEPYASNLDRAAVRSTGCAGLGVRITCAALLHPRAVLLLDLVKDDSKNEQRPTPSEGRNLVIEHDCGDADAEHLPSCHDNCEHDRTELLDGEKDSKLPGG